MRRAQRGRAGVGVLLVEIRGLDHRAGRQLEAVRPLLGPDVELLREDACERLGLRGLHLYGLAVADLEAELHLVALVGAVGVVVGHADDDALAGVHAAHLLDVGLGDGLAGVGLKVVADETNRRVEVGGNDGLRQPAWLALRHHARLVLIDRGHAVARCEAERITRDGLGLGLRRQQHRPGGVHYFQLGDPHRGAGELLDVHAHVTARGVRELDGRTGEIERVRRDDTRALLGGRTGVIRRRRHGGPVGEVGGNLDRILDRPLVLGDAVVAPLERAELGGLLEVHGDELRRAAIVQAFP